MNLLVCVNESLQRVLNKLIPANVWLVRHPGGQKISDLRISESQISESQNLRSQISDLRISESQNLRSQISDLRSQISNLRSQISDLRSQISNLRISDLRSDSDLRFQIL